MAKHAINCSSLTIPLAPLSHAVRAGNLLFVSGTTPMDASRKVARGDFSAQMHQTMANLEAVLAEAGATLKDVVKMNVILDRIGDFQEMNEIYRQYFDRDGGPYPARTTIQGRLPNKDFLLEIECVADLEGGASGR